jgi:hypothetical protein
MLWVLTKEEDGKVKCWAAPELADATQAYIEDQLKADPRWVVDVEAAVQLWAFVFDQIMPEGGLSRIAEAWEIEECPYEKEDADGKFLIEPGELFGPDGVPEGYEGASILWDHVRSQTDHSGPEIAALVQKYLPGPFDLAAVVQEFAVSQGFDVGHWVESLL